MKQSIRGQPESSPVQKGAGMQTRTAHTPEVLNKTFVHLADTLAPEFNVGDFLSMLAEQAVSVLEVDAAGVMLADSPTTPYVAAASDARAHKLGSLDVQDAA